MRRTIMAGLAAAWLFPAAGIAAPPQDIQATLTVYTFTNDAQIQIMNNAIVRFNHHYPNVKVEMQYSSPDPWGEYINRFINLVASDETPDIVRMPIEGVSSLATRDVLIPLDDIVAADAGAKELMADIEPNLVDGLRWDGRLYFFPDEWNNVVLFYNQDMFNAAGLPPPSADWSWDDFLAAARALTRRDASGNVSQWGYFVPGANFVLASWFLTNGTDTLTADWKQSNVRDPKYRESLQFLYDLIHKDKVSPAFAKGDIGANAFAAGQAAMFSAGHWPLSDLRDSGKNIAVQLMPRGTDAVTVYGVAGGGITKASANPELAWEFIKEISSIAAQQELAGFMHGIPVRRSIATAADYVAWPENSKIFYETAAAAKPIASPPNFGQVEEIVLRNVELYLTDNASLDDTIDGLDRELSRAMSRVRW